MRAHCLLHVPFEGPGTIAAWLNRSGAEVTYTRFWEDASLPSLDGIDVLIAMGGPMSVNDESGFPWLVEEKKFIREAVERGVAVLGVCLGAQLIASAMGARVFPNQESEIGWFPVHSTREAGRSVFRFPQEFTAFHWHGETFHLPAGAIQLARSAGCEQQAFQIGDWTIGLQFHLEMTPEGLRGMLEHGGHELVSSRFVQTPERISAARGDVYDAMHGLMDDVLDFLTRE